MNKIIFFLLLPIFANSQQLEPIWKLKWGMEYKSAINFIKSTRNVEPISVKGDTSFMVTVEYRDQLFDGHNAFGSLLYFLGNKLLRIEVFFVNYPIDNNKSFELFDSIKTTLSSKYFEPQYCENANEFVDKNKKMDAINRELAKYYCNWFFPKNDDSEKGGRIFLHISKQGSVVLIYDYIKAYNISNSDF